MNKFFKVIVVSLFAAASCLTSACGNKTDDTEEGKAMEIEKFDGEEKDICCDRLRKYLSLTDEDEMADFLTDHYGDNYDYQNVRMKWRSCGSEYYVAHLSENENCEGEYTEQTDKNYINFGMLTPGKTYFWKVTDSEGKTSSVDSFSVKDAPVRIITAQESSNIRDIGGWETENGRVKYGLLFRGGTLQNLTDRGKSMMKDALGIKTELDLRSSSDDHGQTKSLISEDLNYFKYSMCIYSYIIPEFKQEYPKTRRFDAYAPIAIKKCFEVLADESNYPIYFHCNAGADRTGTLAFLINGLLGVCFEDLTRDFEITSFSVYGKRWRSDIEDGCFDKSGVMQDDEWNFVAWNEMYELMMKYYSGGEGTLSQAVENYLINVCGVTSEQINNIKRIMLEN